MPVEVKRWKKVWDKCPWSTAFSSPLWQGVVEAIEPRNETYEWEGIFTPLSKISLAKGFLQGFESSVPGVPAGPVSEREPSDTLVNDYWNDLNRRTSGRFLVHMRPDSPFTNTTFKMISTPGYVLNLKDRDKKLRSHHRRLVKKAREAGITVSKARRESDIDAYFDMYEASVKRWRKKSSRVYPKSFFDDIHRYLIGTDAASLFLAYKNEKPQAGALILYEPDRAVYWHGSTISNPEPGSAQLLHVEIMNTAANNGVTLYDFGPSAGLQGVERFKQGFGAGIENMVTVLGPAKAFTSYFLRRKRR